MKYLEFYQINIQPNTVIRQNAKYYTSKFLLIRYFMLIVLLEYILILSLTFHLINKDSQYTEIILPIMLSLYLMLSGTYFAQNYAKLQYSI